MRVEECRPEGLFRIVDITTERNKHHIGDVVCFPFSLKEERPGRWFYVNYDKLSEHAGKSTRSSTILEIDILTDAKEEVETIHVKTLNTIYSFERIM